MSGVGRDEAVVGALVVSVILHGVLMVVFKPQLMTHAVTRTHHTPHRVQMKVAEPVSADEVLATADLQDLVAKKDAPAAMGAATAPLADAPTALAPDIELPEFKTPESELPQMGIESKFDTAPVGASVVPVSVMPLTKLETPKAKMDDAPPPDFTVRLPTVAKVAPPQPPALDLAPGALNLPSRMTVRSSGEGLEAPVKFTPAKEVYQWVDEQVVANEKAAVRELVTAEDAADLVKFVNVTMTATKGDDGMRYFKVMMTPRTDLAIVPKDVVMVIDGSGSIGNDRLSSCRKVARRILRTCTNTGDRFNLVVFRNAFSYAFRSWRDCDAASFEAGDRWLTAQTAHGRTDVFSTISSVLTLPRDPKRPLIALVVTDGDANSGVSNTAEILSRFTALNDGLVSVYMYGVKSSANRELIDVLTHGNRGESFIYEGSRWNAGAAMETLSERFRDPVLSDLRVVFSSDVKVESYPRLLRNLYRGSTLEFYGRVPVDADAISFSVTGINGANAYEGFFKLRFIAAPEDKDVIDGWKAELAIDRKFDVWR